jgi:acetoin utilization deacetylase AcuC-like enzyme
MIGIAYHQDYLKHDTGRYHPECAQRLVSIVEHLKGKDIAHKLLWLTPHKADIEYVQLVHTSEYIHQVKNAVKTNMRYLDADTIICKYSYDIALLAVGGVIQVIDEIIHGNISTGMALVRPPGHHAEMDRGMGFCIFNNIAIGAKYLQEKHDIHKIVIIDFDVHHGNGTQSIFYDNSKVLFCSFHQYPFYPGTGAEHEKGINNGYNFTLNYPMSSGTTIDEYQRIFEQELMPVLLEYKPEFILVSAGFDAYENDPLGGLCISQDGYYTLGKLIKEIANTTCNGRVASVLEGGYNISALGRLVEKYLHAFVD